MSHDSELKNWETMSTEACNWTKKIWFVSHWSLTCSGYYHSVNIHILDMPSIRPWWSLPLSMQLLLQQYQNPPVKLGFLVSKAIVSFTKWHHGKFYMQNKILTCKYRFGGEWPIALRYTYDISYRLKNDFCKRSNNGNNGKHKVKIKRKLPIAND